MQQKCSGSAQQQRIAIFKRDLYQHQQTECTSGGSVCTLYLLTFQVRIAKGDAGLYQNQVKNCFVYLFILILFQLMGPMQFPCFPFELITLMPLKETHHTDVFKGKQRYQGSYLPKQPAVLITLVLWMNYFLLHQ